MEAGPLQRSDNVGKRTSINDHINKRTTPFRSSGPASTTSGDSDSSYMSREVARSADYATQAFATPDRGRRAGPDFLGEPPLTHTSPSMKRRAVILPPGTPPNKPDLSPNRPSPQAKSGPRPRGTALVDPGPIPLLPFSRGIENRASPQSGRIGQFLLPGSPTTPIRRKSAKELINHFEEQSSASKNIPSAPRMKYSASSPTPTRSPLSEARLNGPLPELPPQPTFPLEGPQRRLQASPGKSPIRSLMNMVGLGRKDKSTSPGRRTSPSPTPKRRALLAEDDEVVVRPRSGSILREVDAMTSRTLSSDHSTPARDLPVFGEVNPGQSPNPLVLRTGSLLYASPSTNSLSSPTWYSAQATLKPPTLSLSSSAFLPPDSAPDHFRSFDLHHATVESKPSIAIDAATTERLQLLGTSPSRSTGMTIYLFEISFPPSSRSSSALGSTELFATTSAWDRGKWVCHIWDAICGANVSRSSSSPRDEHDATASSKDSSQGQRSSGTSSPPQALHSRYPASSNANGSVEPLIDSDADDESFTQRLQPPLRVVNVSKLSAFFDTDSAYSPHSFTTSDSSHPPPSSASTTKSTTDAFTNLGVPSAKPLTIRSAPLAAPSPFGLDDAKEAKDRAMKTRSRSVPCSPSINDLGKMTLVQQRLARFESAKAEVSPLRQEPRGRLPIPVSLRNREADIGLTTPPVTPGSQNTPLPSTRPPLTPLVMSKRPSDMRPPVMEGWQPPVISPLQLTFPRKGGSNDQGSASDTSTSADVFLSNINPSISQDKPSARLSQTPSQDYRLSTITSLPANEYPDISPLFSLVRDTAKEQAAQVKALATQLESIRGELKSEGSSVKAASPADYNRTGSTDDWEIKAILDEIQDKLDTHVLKDGAADLPPNSADALLGLQKSIDGLRQRELAQQQDSLHTIGNQLGAVQSTLTVVHETHLAEQTLLSTKLESLEEKMQPLDLNSVNERLDGMRASLAVLEAMAQTPAPVSAFRNAAKQVATPPVDLSSIHDKLDKLTNVASSEISSPELKEKLDALMDICTQLSSAGAAAAPAAESQEIEKLMAHLQDDQSNQEKYYTDLNEWLQGNATRTGGQFHAIQSQLEQISQALASLGPDPEETSDTSDAPASDQQETKPPSSSSNIFQDIRTALVENNKRNRTNDNFLAAANHLINAANAERQSLSALITSQREENQKLLDQFAERVTQEIRGQKHSFVDAMEKATALNVEGQLRELKGQISAQLVDMARGVERLLDERKVLETQISDLLAFKNRFATPESLERSPVSPGQYVASATPRPAQNPRQSPIHPQFPPPIPNPSYQQSDVLFPPQMVSSRPLPSPINTQTQRRHQPPYHPQMGQRF